MSLLVNEDGSVRNYVVIDPVARTVLAGYNTVQQAHKGVTALKKDGSVPEAILHNITHNACPDWLKEYVRSDSAYCARRADEIEKRADAYRRRAAAELEAAEQLDATAARFRAYAESAAPGGPKI
jgi:hypothetical protein